MIARLPVTRRKLAAVVATWIASAGILIACEGTDGLNDGLTDASVDGFPEDRALLDESSTQADVALIDGGEAGCVIPPVEPGFLSDAIEIDSSGPFVCALRENGQVVCWGFNEVGQLGTSPEAGAGVMQSSRPLVVTGIPTASHVAAGYAHACAVVTNGEVRCWGAGEKGQTGSDGSEPRPGLNKIYAESFSLLTNVIAISAGGAFNCALTQGGGVQCWGENHKGQLGVSGFASSPAAQVVPGIGISTTISAGFFHACALVNGPSPSARCWGSAQVGELGIPDAFDGGGSPPITYGALGATPARVVASSPDTCVIDINGNAICSGYNTSGQLGATSSNGSITSPFPIPELSSGDIVDIDIGMSHSCGTRKNGTAFCLSGLPHDSLGRGPIDASSGPDNGARPVLGPGTGTDPLAPVAIVKVGSKEYGAQGHSCALVKPACAPSGQVYCWGRNEFGQVGDGTTTARSRPVKVLAP